MWIDLKAALSEIEGTAPATPATPATSEGGVADVAGVAAPQAPTCAPDPDGVARTPEAIERVRSDAIRRAVEYRKTAKPPTCARCGVTAWDVTLTEPDGRRLHVHCWKAESLENEQAAASPKETIHECES